MPLTFRLSQKSQSSNALYEQIRLALADFGSGLEVNERTAFQVAAALCAGRVISEGVAQLPIKVFRTEERDGKMFKREARDHWSWSLLRDHPNDLQTSFEFRETLVLHAVFAGDGFAFINRGAGTGKVMELIPIAPEMVTVVQLPGFDVAYEVRDKNGLVGRFDKKSILHLKGPSWNGFHGLPLIKLCRKVLGLSVALQDNQSRLHAKGGVPTGILTAKEGLSKEAKERLVEAWAARYGAGGEGGIAVLDAAFDFQQLAMTGVDAQHLESRRFQIEEIARLFRVHPLMLMQADKTATYASAEQFFLNHVIHTLDPWLVRLEQVYHRDVLEGDNELDPEFIRAGLLRGSSRDRAEYFKAALGSGGHQPWMTANEVRALDNLNPIEGGDELPKPVAMSTDRDSGSEADGNDN